MKHRYLKLALTALPALAWVASASAQSTDQSGNANRYGDATQEVKAGGGAGGSGGAGGGERGGAASSHGGGGNAHAHASAGGTGAAGSQGGGRTGAGNPGNLQTPMQSGQPNQ